MSNKSVRIPTTVNGNDKYLTVKLENDVDFFEILSLNISQKDVYGTFNSDYGVIVGRVVANGGVGIPNVKLSVFIPISDDDKLRADIVAVYPYTSPRDKDLNGVKYNLLPRIAVNNPFLVDGDYAPKVPIGTFPTKEEITTNDTFLEVYEKYYKFNTVTNQSGDYMIFGVPIGIQTVHMSVDITDIGKYSMNPPTMINQLGYSKVLFDEDGTKIKFSTDLETLPNVETQEVAVEVRPFWGDSENFEIGITRQDFKIRAILTSSFVVFGAGFTDGDNSAWAKDYASGDQIQEFFRIQNEGNLNTSIASKRNSLEIIENIFYYPPSISDADIESGNVDPAIDIKQLTSSEYTRFIELGQFVYVIACNRKKIVTNEFGDDVEVESNSSSGIFTEFKGFMTFQYSDLTNLPVDTDGEIDGRGIRVLRNKYKFPQNTPRSNTALGRLNKSESTPDNDIWRKQYFTFKGSEIYSVAKFQHLYYNKDSGDSANGPDILDRERFNNVGIIMSGDIGDIENNIYQFPTNGNSGGVPAFGGQWLNFSIHFIQQGYVTRSGSQVKTNYQWNVNEDSFHFISNNTQLIAATVKDTRSYARNDRNQTTFIRVTKEDLLNIYNDVPSKGFNSSQIFSFVLTGDYANGVTIDTTPTSGGKVNGVPANPLDDKFYFYKGHDTADCIEFLIRLNIV